MAGEPYTAVGADCTIGPPNFGLTPEQIRYYNQKARVRIAAENAVKEAQNAERAERKAAAKQQKLAARRKIHVKSDNGEDETDEDSLIKEKKQEKKGVFGSLKDLLKKDNEDNYVR